MDEQELENYLKQNLKLQWQMDKNCNHYLALVLKGETISRVKFDVD